MPRRATGRLTLALAVLLANSAAHAQDSDKPREFAELRGTWILDEKATLELRYVKNRLGESQPVDTIGFNVARTLVVTTTPTEMAVTKDADLSQVYRFDGSETQTRDPRTGVAFTPRYSFTLVAETLALTTKRSMAPDRDGRARTEITTDAYSLPEWDVLVIERQVSVLIEPPGSLMTLSGLRNNKATFVYRRAAARLPQ